jgi:Lon protease-like protein
MFIPTSTRYEDLPCELSVFPLTGVVLLPGGRLPLNIFAPRYLNLTLDALSAGRMFGMIQPDYDALGPLAADDDDDEEQDDDTTLGLLVDDDPPLYRTGCIGRIVSFEETEDGRLLIALRGLSRFHMLEELDGVKGYRRVRADYSPFVADMDPPQDFDLDRDTLLDALRPYVDVQGLRLKVDIIKGLSNHTLVSSLCMICPFDPREKQALLESITVADRAAMLLALLQMGVFETGILEGSRQ